MRTPEQIDAANRFESYRRGWGAGATSRATDPRLATHADQGIRDAYNRGYADGRRALNDAMRDASSTYGHVPSILRLADATNIAEPG